eukprot:CFRG6240T1
MFQSHANQPHSPPWSSVGINIETNKTLDTTGGHLWDAAKRLFEFMENEQETYDLSRDGLRMLELGSGTGWLGIALAMNLHNADSIVTTEQDGGGAMEYLERNVENHKYFLKNPSVLTAHSLDWSRILDSSTANLENELNESAYDIVFGSDLLYNLDGVEMLPKVMAAFCATGATVLYAHTFNRYEFLDADFFFALRRQGLICREVWSSSDVPPEFTPTDERFCNVFPEARIAILDIRVLRKQDPALVRKYALVKTTPDITAMPTGGQQVGADATTSTPTPTFESMHTVEGIYTETDATLNALHEEIVLYLMDKVDLPAVVNLRATSRNNHFSNIFPENWLACHDFNTLMYDVWSKNLTSPTRLTIGARDAFGQLIGFVHTDTRNYVHENFGLCIDDIHVASPGAGLGRKLFKALVYGKHATYSRRMPQLCKQTTLFTICDMRIPLRFLY